MQALIDAGSGPIFAAVSSQANRLTVTADRSGLHPDPPAAVEDLDLAPVT